MVWLKASGERRRMGCPGRGATERTRGVRTGGQKDPLGLSDAGLDPV